MDSLPVASQSPLALGCLYALLVMVNPCTVPFLTLVLSWSAERVRPFDGLHAVSMPINAAPQALVALAAFSLGLLTPALCVTIAGRGALVALRKRRGLVWAMSWADKCAWATGSTAHALGVSNARACRAVSTAVLVTGAWLVAEPVGAFASADVILASRYAACTTAALCCAATHHATHRGAVLRSWRSIYSA